MRKSNMYDRRRNRNTFSPNPWKNRHNLAGLLPTFVPPARRPSARTRQRQTTACGHRAYAKREELEVVEEYYDGDVRGADPIETRPGFSALLKATASERSSLRMRRASPDSSSSRKPESLPLSNGAFACSPRLVTSRPQKTPLKSPCGRSV